MGNAGKTIPTYLHRFKFEDQSYDEFFELLQKK